jgi:hypothetical protein
MRPRSLAIWCAGVIGAAIVGGIIVRDIRLATEAANQQTRLTLEFEQLAPPTTATSRSISAGHKLETAWVETTYNDRLQSSDLLAHYDRAFAESGWRFLKDGPIRELSGDFGLRIRYYCKPPCTAVLAYSGDPRHYEWTFSLDLS